MYLLFASILLQKQLFLPSSTLVLEAPPTYTYVISMPAHNFLIMCMRIAKEIKMPKDLNASK